MTAENSTTIKKTAARREDVDFFRFFAIVLMIAGHVAKYRSSFNKYIHAFHMPLWFILSGYFCNVDRPFLKTLRLRVQKLLLPYFCFALIYECIWTVQGKNQWMGILYPNSIQVPLNGALWFLPALFFVDVISTFLLKFLPFPAAAAAMTSLSVFGCMQKKSLPFSLDSALAGIGLFGIGYCVRKLEKYTGSEPVLVLDILLLRVVSLLIRYNGYVNMRSRKYGILLLFWINATAATLIFWHLCRWAWEYMKIPFRNFCREAGSQSIIYVCANQYILHLLGYVIRQDRTGPALLLIRILLVILDLLICFALNRLIRKTPLRFILGTFGSGRKNRSEAGM